MMEILEQNESTFAGKNKEVFIENSCSLNDFAAINFMLSDLTYLQIENTFLQKLNFE